MSSILNYNEKKVSQELAQTDPDLPPKHAAELLHANGFLKDVDRMNYYDKAERFTQINELNDRTKVNMMHISLNFDPSEKDMSNEKMVQIAERYMEGIGFKDQPYLVYKHNDAGHPHLHIVTNIIKADGQRIDTHKIGALKSEPTRQAIEKEFNLVTAEQSREQKKIFDLKPVDASKVMYGTEQETKKAMQQAIHQVYRDYKFASLPEYNAALRQYNVIADPGEKGSRIAQHGGLVYRALSEEGQKVGPPIKASSFYFKPTLENLEGKYKDNAEARKADLPSMTKRIDWALLQNPDSFRAFIESLQKEGIEVAIRQNKDGRVYGMTYVDNRTKSVVNGSQLGKGYSAGGIISRFEIAQTRGQSNENNPAQSQQEAAIPRYGYGEGSKPQAPQNARSSFEGQRSSFSGSYASGDGQLQSESSSDGLYTHAA